MIDRDAAQEAARDELRRAPYHRDDPGLLERAWQWVQDRLSELFDRIGEATPGGGLNVLIVIALVALVVAVVLYRVGGVRRDATRAGVLPADRTRTAAEYRAAAEAAAQRGEWALAVRDRLRALAATLEERGVLVPRAGRTADELAAEAAAQLPIAATALRSAARTFDDVHYGGRPATPDSYAVVVHADDQVRAARTGATGVPS